MRRIDKTCPTRGEKGTVMRCSSQASSHVHEVLAYCTSLVGDGFARADAVAAGVRSPVQQWRSGSVWHYGRCCCRTTGQHFQQSASVSLPYRHGLSVIMTRQAFLCSSNALLSSFTPTWLSRTAMLGLRAPSSTRTGVALTEIGYVAPLFVKIS